MKKNFKFQTEFGFELILRFLEYLVTDVIYPMHAE